MANLLRTETTYATYENALKALDKTLAKFGTPIGQVRYLIAARTVEGNKVRFAPVLVGNEYIQYAVNANITVVS